MSLNNFYLPELTINVSKKENPSNLEKFKCCDHAEIANLLRTLFNQDLINWTEEFIMICLNTANYITSYYKISSGGTSTTVVDAKVVYTVALKSGANKIIVAHNHPSGNLTPSDADIRLTRKLKEGGKVLDVELMDHFIITPNSYYSFNEEGALH